MSLIPTYYDFVKKVRPMLVEMAEADATELRKSSPKIETILSVDEYESRFPALVKQMDDEKFAEHANNYGMTIHELKKTLASLNPQFKTEMLNLYSTVNFEFHSLVNFALSGKKTFHFSDNLSDHLVNTEINVKAGIIFLPFPSCLFTFTSRSAINALYNMQGDLTDLSSISTKIDYSAPVSVFLSTHPAGNNLPGEKLLIVAWHAKAPSTSYFMVKRELYLGEDWTLEQALCTDWETLTPDDLGVSMQSNADGSEIVELTDDKFYTDGLVFFRMVLNAILYLSSDSAETIAVKSSQAEIVEKASRIESASKRRKALQALGRFSELDFNEVGSTVGTIIIQKDKAIESGKPALGSKPNVRFMVRGHWRQQPFGQNGQERKLTWIRPYFKGPDLAVLINKPYQVK